jgi:seryl-tRNA(Sec) selenium transferase
MAMILTVKGANINIELSEYEITSFGFIYNAQNSKYAKSGDERCLKIIGSISAMMEHNPSALTAIREWAKIGRVSEDCYTEVKVTVIYREEEVRSITLPDAFIKTYEENIDPHSGQGELTLLLMQKQDKRTDIVIDPFNQVVTFQ